METSPPITISLIFSETNRIIRAQPRHFLILSFLFIIPNSIASLFYPIILPTLAPSSPKITSFAHACFLIVSITLSISSVGSITYSAIKAYGKFPINVKSAIKSLSASFFRILVTNLLTCTIYSLVAIICFAPSIIAAMLLDFSSPTVIILCVGIAMIIGLPSVIFLQLNWTVSSAVIVAETTWGVTPLKRSWSLIKGRRWLVFALYLCLAFPMDGLSWIVARLAWPALGLLQQGNDKLTMTWLALLTVLVCIALRTLIVLYTSVAATVLYVYCNNSVFFHGQNNYVSLFTVDDEEKVPSISSYV